MCEEEEAEEDEPPVVTVRAVAPAAAPVETDGQHALLVRDLRSLRGHRGLALRKLKTKPNLLAALARRVNQTSITVDHAREVLIAELTALGGGRDVRAVRNALGIDNQLSTVTERRSKFGAAEGNMSTDTVENWENDGFEELASRLGRSEPHHAEGLSLSPIAGQATTRGYIFQRVDRVSIYKNCSLVEVINTRTVRAEIDGVDTVYSRFRHGSDPASVRLHALAGCSIVKSSLNQAGVLVSRIQLSRTLARGQTMQYTTRVIVDSKSPSEPWLIFGSSPEARYEHLFLRFQFDRDSRPTVGWYLENATYMNAPGEPTPHNRIEVDPNGYLEKQFQAVAAGLCQVVAWGWPSSVAFGSRSLIQIPN